ncbi:MAG: NAD(P)H-dependent oxidoreductase [Simkaniaceae bacterium]
MATLRYNAIKATSGAVMKKNVLLLSAALIFVFSSLTCEMKVLAFAGSIREDSYNKQLIQEAAGIARQMGASVTVVTLNDFPMAYYDADLEATYGMPANAKRFRNLMIQSDAIIIASPEYNSSIPGILKNTLDWASRDENGNPSRTAFTGKKFAIMSASPSPSGGNRGLVHLQSIIEEVGGEVMSKQVSISNAHQYFSQKERPQNEPLKEEVQQLLLKASKE